MTDKEQLFSYRIKQAADTLLDAEKMLQSNFNPRSIINRAYYAAFYAVLALFLKDDVQIKTSKHTGVIAIFDREFVKANRIDKHYSQVLHTLFDARLEGDYKELVELTVEEAAEQVKLAKDFLQHVKAFIQNSGAGER